MKKYLIIPALLLLSNFNFAQVYSNDSTYLSEDVFGNTIGNIGDDNVFLQEDVFGNTIGNIGDDSVFCSTDYFGNTTCN